MKLVKAFKDHKAIAMLPYPMTGCSFTVQSKSHDLLMVLG